MRIFRARSGECYPAKHGPLRRVVTSAVHVFIFTALGFGIFRATLVATSQPLTDTENEIVNRSVSILEDKGFSNEALILRNGVSFRRSDNWLNRFADRENAYAATNFPFGIVTVYPDFFSKAEDDTERAMILLHEAQHLTGATEAQAYRYVWGQRSLIGWTQLKYGVTPTYITIELQTREYAPDVFTCSRNVWSDCTERYRASR